MSTSTQNDQVFESLRRANYVNAINSYKNQVEESERAASMAKHEINGERVQAERIEEHVKTKSTSRIVVETGDQIEAAPEMKEEGSAPKLQLPAPQTKAANDPFAPNLKDVSMVAILGEALAAQAKSSSTLYSSFFQQASASMMASASLIDPVQQAVQENWNQQSAATQADATKSQGDGWINLTFGAVTMGMGLMGAWEELAKPVAAADETEEDAATAAKNAEKDGKPSDSKTAGDFDSGIDDSGKPNEQSKSSQSGEKEQLARGDKKITKNLVEKGNEMSNLEKNVRSGGKKLKSVMECLYKGFTKAAGSAAGFQMLATGIAGVSVDSKQEGIKAAAQANAGKADAFSKAGEMYSQFYTQGFNRTEDLRQGAQQNVDLSINILKSGADTITQAITSQRI